MSIFEQFLWGIFPYICLSVFIVGHIFRYRHDQFNWTAKSSEFLEKKQLMIGSMLFHIGIIPVAGGHAMGLLVPKEWLVALGVSDHMYHIGAVYIGGLFGIMTFAGMLILTARRFTVKSVRKLSSTSDIIVNIMLLLIVFLGIYTTFVVTNVQPDFDYRETVGVWVRNIFIFQPNISLMESVPVFLKGHIIMAFLIIALWPFTRLVHVWSVPFKYTNRSYILYRKNKGSSIANKR